MPKAEHFRTILDGLDVGLEDHEDVHVETPLLLDEMPPTRVRCIVTIDGENYAVTVESADA